MALRINYQIKSRRSWWVDVLFYFALSLLAAAVLCWLIFSVKVSMQKKDIKELDSALQSVGTEQQKSFEKTVFSYQKKVNDFAVLLKNRQFVSSIFNLMEQQTFFNVWFEKFSMNKKDGEIDVSGEADNMAALSRQVSVLEKNEYVKKITVLSSKLGSSGKVDFNLSIIMDQKIFSPSLASIGTLLLEVTPSSQKIFNTSP